MIKILRSPDAANFDTSVGFRSGRIRSPRAVSTELGLTLTRAYTRLHTTGASYTRTNACSQWADADGIGWW
ncbi:hypothetical protein K445DRAFT_319912 [Daldinia sp. EC12]|nr:hypothetical protein K445DRAFT_319912 [Daldinia sp. EC12]